MNKLHIHERICTSYSERVNECVRWLSHHWSNVNTCTCMVLRTPVWIHTTLPARNAHTPVYARPYNGAQTFLPWKLLRTYLEYCGASCGLSFATHSCRPSCCLDQTRRPTPFAQEIHPNVLSRNPSKSTLAHDAVAAAVSQKHHSIIRVGTGRIQFACRSHSRLSTEFILLCSPFFLRAF